MRLDTDDARGAERPAGGSIRSRLESAGRLRATPPPGRNLAILVIAALAVAAAVWSFLDPDSGPRRAIRDLHERDLEPRTAPEGPAGPRSPEVEEVAPPAPALPEVGAEIPIPPDLDPAIARRLRLALAGMRESRLMAEAGARELPDVVAAAPAAQRGRLRVFVVDRLARAVADGRLRVAALDAALALAGADPTGLEPLVEATLVHALGDDPAAPAALVFLGALPDLGGEAARAALEALADDPLRPLHLRAIAARVLGRG